MKSERLQVLIERSQRERLERLSKDRGVSVAALVREAIDASFPPKSPRRGAAARAILAADLMPVPELDGLRAELDEAHSIDLAPESTGEDSTSAWRRVGSPK